MNSKSTKKSKKAVNTPKTVKIELTPSEKLDKFGVDNIIEKVAEGEFYQDIAKEIGVARNTLLRWMNETHADLFARAREARADKMAEDITDISDNQAGEVLMVDGVPMMMDGKPVMVVTSQSVQHAKLRVDSRKWLASKMFPKQYGDKQEVNLSGSIDIAATILEARKRSGVK
jgi:hypothetical protein